MPCDAACQAKIRLNGARIVYGLQATLAEVNRHTTNDGVLKHGEEMIKLLNKMEDLSDEFASMAIKDIGYAGPLNRSLDI